MSHVQEVALFRFSFKKIFFGKIAIVKNDFFVMQDECNLTRLLYLCNIF